MHDLSSLVTYTVYQWLSYIDPVTYDFFEKFGLAFLIGILFGIERERKSDRGDIFAGVRTYTIASILGMISGYLSINQGTPIILYLTTMFFIVLASIMIYIKNVVYRQVGTTGGIAMFFVFLMGVLVAYDYYLFAIMSSVAVTFLLIEKYTLRSFATHMTHDELTNAIQFLIIIFILFPITPDITILKVINLRYVLGIVVIVSLISFISFLLMKKSAPERGIPLSGFIGGMFNSEATAGALAGLVKKKKDLLDASHQGIVLSNATMLIRNLVIAYIVDPSGRVLILMLPPQLLLIGVNIGMVVKGLKLKPVSIETLNIESPFALKPAFKFALGFTVLIVLAHYLNIWFGDAGVFVVALGGLVSSASVTASVGALAFGGTLSPTTAALVAVLSSVISTSNKIFLVKLAGSDELYEKVQKSFFSLMVVGTVAFLLWMLINLLVLGYDGMI